MHFILKISVGSLSQSLNKAHKLCMESLVWSPSEYLDTYLVLSPMQYKVVPIGTHLRSGTPQHTPLCNEMHERFGFFY